MDEKDKQIEALKEEVKSLKKRLLQFERMLGLNSRNSSKPPSSDGLRKKPSPQSLRNKGKKPSGGQKGHKGKTLYQVDDPDSIIVHSLEICSHCQIDISDVSPIGFRKRQVFDIPAIEIHVTQHQAETKVCKCCSKETTASFPAGVNAPVQYGDHLKSFAIYLNVRQYIPEDRLQEMFSDLLNIPISTATLVNICNAFGDSVEEFDEKTFKAIKSACVKHSDETGFRIGGRTCWLHLLSTGIATHYWISQKRGDVVKNLTSGVHIHDHFKPYYTHNKEVKHGLCNAHHLRELKALIEIEKEKWAIGMRRFLIAASRYQGQDPPPDRLNRLYAIYDKIVDRGLAYHESLRPLEKGKRGRGAKRTGHNLLIRLRDFKEDVLRFLTDKNVAFTNNLAERDVRMMKVRQKISGGFRTISGALTFCRIRGFISTMCKQGRNILGSIQTVLQGNAHILYPV